MRGNYQNRSKWVWFLQENFHEKYLKQLLSYTTFFCNYQKVRTFLRTVTLSIGNNGTSEIAHCNAIR